MSLAFEMLLERDLGWHRYIACFAIELTGWRPIDRRVALHLCNGGRFVWVDASRCLDTLQDRFDWIRCVRSSSGSAKSFGMAAACQMGCHFVLSRHTDVADGTKDVRVVIDDRNGRNGHRFVRRVGVSGRQEWCADVKTTARIFNGLRIAVDNKQMLFWC